jgi:hypothetical protein
VLKPLSKSISSYLDKMKEQGLVRDQINTLAFPDFLSALFPKTHLAACYWSLQRSNGLNALRTRDCSAFALTDS